VYEVERGLAEVSITAIFAFFASGMMCLPMLIYPYKRISSKIKLRVPVGWSMTKTYKTFEEMVGNELKTEHKVRENETEPVLKRQIDALEEISSEELELPGSNSVIIQIQEILARNKEKRTNI
jgi:hypothetical protein